MSSLIRQLAIAAKGAAGIVSHGTIFHEIKKANEFRIGSDARAKAIAAVEEKLDTFDRAQQRPTEEDLQIITNLKVLLNYYKARDIPGVLDRKAEWERLNKEKRKKVRSFLISRTPVNPEGTLVQSAQAITSAEIAMHDELLRHPEFNAEAEAAYLKNIKNEVAANNVRNGEAALGLIREGLAMNQTSALALLKKGEGHIAAARLQKQLANMRRLGGRRQTRRKHRKGKKSTRRR
jgi:hypothetical protein